MASERRSIPPRRHASLSSGTAGPPSGSLVSSTDFSLPELAVPVARAAHDFTARLPRLTPREAVEARAFVQTHTGALAVERSFAVGAPPVAQTVHSLLSREQPVAEVVPRAA